MKNCLRPVRNQPLLVYNFVNYLCYTQHSSLTQVPSSDNVQLVSKEILTEDSDNPVELLDVRAITEYLEAQELEDKQALQQLVKQEFENIGEAIWVMRWYFLKESNNPLGLAYGFYRPAHYRVVSLPGMKTLTEKCNT